MLLPVVGVGQTATIQSDDSLGNGFLNSYWNENAKHTHSPLELLQGDIPGLHITKPGSDPNGHFDVRIRGLTTLLNDAQPLYVIDGVPGVPLSMVDPQNIESIEVVKGASTARWGIRGARGVIRIKTKEPQAGKISAEFRSYVALDQLGPAYDVLDAADYLEKQERISGSYERPSPQENNWIDIITRAAPSTASNFSVTGGTEALGYRVALNWKNVEGIAIHTGYDRLNGRLHLQSKLLNDKLDLGLSMAGTSESSDIGFKEAFKYAVTFNPTAPRQGGNEQFGGFYQFNQFDYYNPLAIMEQNMHEGKDRQLSGSLKATYHLNAVLEGLSVEVLLSITREDLFRGEFYPAESFYQGYDSNGFARTQSDDKTNRRGDFRLHWQDYVGENLQVRADIGYMAQNLFHEYRLKVAENIPNAESYTVIENRGNDVLEGDSDVVEEDHLLAAFYGNAKIDGAAWYLEGGLRYEGSSYLGSNSKWGMFPFVRAGYDINSILDFSFAESLTLHAGYGLAGNVPVRSGWSKDLYQPSGYYYQDGEYLPTYTQSQGRNSDLKWESTAMWNSGFDFVSAGGRFKSNIDLFLHRSSDLIMNAELPNPPYSGNRGYLNIGEITNRGIEIGMQYEVIQQLSLSYSTGLNISTIKTSYGSLSNDFYSLDGQLRGFPSGACGCSVTFLRIQEKAPAGQLHGPEFVGFNGDGEWILRQTDRVNDWPNIGNGLPTAMLGWFHRLKFGNWRFGVLLRGVFGHDLVSETRLTYENRNLGTYNILESSPKNLEEFNNWSSYYVEDGDYLELENLTVSYQLPLGQSNRDKTVELFLGVENLVTITEYSGIDPSARLEDPAVNFLSNGSLPQPRQTDVMVPGIDRPSTWLNSRTWLVGVDLQF
ncbi:SusC/RagA family TonB-linked outer membrane protein [Aliifodinibius sp. S!AR15-10]|uniref:SusC/RagA family TonB-linked outer membrane protein n=1 Tax=Aliifodinibius sp. S!AR15-10 TaxID=2950437 RepID=UPI00285CE9C8|nr:SusC/RagA family TonB-linked outer membrane protein [Aliifodinibius sp. S!AR15-10]MDR8391325.1 SusC/RagA family TonB-linked outer membrane protein [Aliifodinibius sp. S!AR15-10]